MKDYFTTAEVLEKLPRVTKRQLDYWSTAGYVATYDPTPGPGRSRLFHKDEMPTIIYIDILVNQVGVELAKASRIAVAARHNKSVSRGYTWVEDEHGIIIGLPVMESLNV